VSGVKKAQHDCGIVKGRDKNAVGSPQGWKATEIFWGGIHVMGKGGGGVSARLVTIGKRHGTPLEFRKKVALAKGAGNGNQGGRGDTGGKYRVPKKKKGVEQL